MPNKSIIALWSALLIPILACTQEANSQLIEAAKNGETEKVRAALDSGASVDARAEGIVAETALMLAAQKGDADIVQVLLDAGADVDAKDADGWTALVHAAYTIGRTDTVQALLDAGADVDAKDYNGETAQVV